MGQEANDSTQRVASRDMWCEGGWLYAWARRHGGGSVVELFTTLVDSKGPTGKSALFILNSADQHWGVHWDAFRISSHRRRICGRGRPHGEIITGNPPYDAASILQFCR